MGGFFGAVSRRDVISDVFFGTDYHSHLGVHRGGMAAYNEKDGFMREIHNIENSPFRTKFDDVFEVMHGNAAIGCISDTDPQPLLIRSRLGGYAITVVSKINNESELIERFFDDNCGHFSAMSGGRINSTELISAMINQMPTFAEGIKYAQKMIDGTASILIMTDNGTLIAARDRFGRLPVRLGKNEDGYCVSFESFAYHKLGYDDDIELGPGEIVEITADGTRQLSAPGEEMRICSFLWSYYGYSNSTYEGRNVELMRYRNGEIMAEDDEKRGGIESVDYVCGVPDSGTPHAIGYANFSKKPFARPFIKYTPTWPRSFMSKNQQERSRVAKMKQIPVTELIHGKSLLFVDDSIVRGTQLQETVDFLYDNGAKEVHMRSACPPIMYGCRYLNFSTSKNENELIARKTILELEGEEGLMHIDEYSDASTERGRRLRDRICENFHFDSLEFQSLEGLIEAIGIDPCKLCTYCWNGKK